MVGRTLIKEFITALEGQFEEMDNKIIENDISVRLRKREELENITKHPEYIEHRERLNTEPLPSGISSITMAMTYFRHYLAMKIAGSKGEIDLLRHGEQYIIERTISENRSKFEKRNFRISKKLEECGVTKISQIEQIVGNTGFNGAYEVVTDAGEKRLTIRTIIAWGEIQRPHYRTLVKVY